MAAGSDLAGHRIVSDEMLPGGFGTVYGNQQADIARQVNGEYAAGAHQAGLAAAGYSYGYVTPGSLGLPQARVERGRLAPAPTR